MCVASKPSIPTSSASDNKPLPIIRNPILDGMLGDIAALRNGRNALRINLLNPLAIPVGGGGVGSVGGGGGSSGGSSGGTTSSGSTSTSSGSTSTSGGGGGGFSGGDFGHISNF